MKESKKFELTDISVSLFGRKVFRIRSLVDFETKSGNVKVGDLGGYVESEKNLSHEGNAWVYGNAKVWGDAEVYGNAEVWGDAEVYGNAEVWGDAKVCGNAMIRGNAVIWGNAVIRGNAEVWGDAEVYGNAKVWGNAVIWGDAEVYGNAKVWGDAEVYGNAKVWGDAKVCGNAEVYGNAELFECNHLLTISNIGSRKDTTTFFRDENNEIHVACGCFRGTIDDFLKKVKETHGNNRHAKAYTTAIELAKIQIGQYGDQEEEDDE